MASRSWAAAFGAACLLSGFSPAQAAQRELPPLLVPPSAGLASPSSGVDESLRALPARLATRAELPLRRGEAQFYEMAAPFADNLRYDQVFVDLKPGAADAAVRAAASALSQGALSEKVYSRLKDLVGLGAPIPVTAFMPPVAAGLTGRYPESAPYRGCAGPNCWNAVLLWHGLAQSPAYSDDDALLDALADRFRRLGPGERARFGDVLTVHALDADRREVLQHSAIHVGQDLFWHKASKLSETPWTFEGLADVLRVYTEDSAKEGYPLRARLHRRAD